MQNSKRAEIEKKIDILEEDIKEIDPSILKLLLKDKTTKNNILWCTKDYEKYGPEFDEHSQIKIDLITGKYACVIQPRAAKPKTVQELRIKKRAEVFTPSWVCNEQNNSIDEAWFGRSNVFNIQNGTSWITYNNKIVFPNTKGWKSYVDAKRLEITCGEAPYLVSRYDTTTGELIPVYQRIGLFDRKMRIVNENCEDNDLWVHWALRALKSIYGYEYQGDSVLIARENVLYSFMDYYEARFNTKAPLDLLRNVSNIIAWNIWQMDGFRYVVPYSCHDIEIENYQISLLDAEEKQEKMIPCPGCKKNSIFEHTGHYCHIYDWTNLNKSIPFVNVFKKEAPNGKI